MQVHQSVNAVYSLQSADESSMGFSPRV